MCAETPPPSPPHHLPLAPLQKFTGLQRAPKPPPPSPPHHTHRPQPTLPPLYAVTVVTHCPHHSFRAAPSVFKKYLEASNACPNPSALTCRSHTPNPCPNPLHPHPHRPHHPHRPQCCPHCALSASPTPPSLCPHPSKLATPPPPPNLSAHSPHCPHRPDLGHTVSVLRSQPSRFSALTSPNAQTPPPVFVRKLSTVSVRIHHRIMPSWSWNYRNCWQRPGHAINTHEEVSTLLIPILFFLVTSPDYFQHLLPSKG